MARNVADLMVAAVVVADPAETVGEVRQKMSQQDIGAVPVVDSDGVLRGIVTAEDLMKGYEASLPISRVMTRPVQSLPPGAGIARAARHMRERRHHHIVVVDDDRIVGILSSFDLLGLLEDGD